MSFGFLHLPTHREGGGGGVVVQYALSVALRSHYMYARCHISSDIMYLVTYITCLSVFLSINQSINQSNTSHEIPKKKHTHAHAHIHNAALNQFIHSFIFASPIFTIDLIGGAGAGV